MTETASPSDFVYDTVAYPAPVLDIMSPDRLRAAGLLHGWRGPEVASARLLEIGCGDGVNAIAFAAANPNARAVGFDFSREAIARGHALVAAADIRNAVLEVGDIVTYPRDGEPFDYITCHGVLTWVPEDVRHALMDLIATRLAPGGIAYMSYDALPGAAAKQALVRFLRSNIDPAAEPAEMKARAQAIIAILDRTQSADSGLRGQIDFLLQTIEGYDPNFFFHDWLAEHYAPVDPAAFRGDLAKRGLMLAGSTACYDIGTHAIADATARALVEAQGDDHGARLAVLDMLDGGRVFHRDLIVRTDAPPVATRDGLRELSYCYEGRIEPVETEAGPGTRYIFEGDTEVVTTGRATRAVVERLVQADMQDVPYGALLADCGLDEPTLRNELTRLCSALAVKPHAAPERFVRHPGDRPCAGRLVRAMFARGTFAATLRSAAAVAGDNESRYFLVLCDGSRTRAEIAAAMTERFGKETSLDEVDAAVEHFARRAAFEA
jgi:SAM-dependent methyltransferase